MKMQHHSSDQIYSTQLTENLKLLLNYPSVVGAERPFLMNLSRELEALELNVNFYNGLLVASGNRPDQAYVSAHVDRHGLICTGPDEFQYSAFSTINRAEMEGRSISYQTYTDQIVERFVDQKVIAYSPWSGLYLGRGHIYKAEYCSRRENLIFRIKGLENLLPGHPVAYSRRLTIGEDHVSAQLDNVLMVAMLLTLFQSGFQGTGIFTCQEEAGRSWRYLDDYFLCQNILPNKLYVLDTSPFADQAEADQFDIVLRKRDAYSTFDQDLFNDLTKLCEKLGYKWVAKDEYIDSLNKEDGGDRSIGRTELGKLINHGTVGYNGTTIQVPTSGYHTSKESASIRSIDNCLNLLKKLLIDSSG